MDGKSPASKTAAFAIPTPAQTAILAEIAGARQAAHGLVVRAKIVSLTAQGWTRKAISDHLRADLKTVSLWRSRWTAAVASWAGKSDEWDDAAWRHAVEDALTDAPRSGRPCVFQAEEVCGIIATACKSPEEFGHPHSHWSHTSLRDEVVKQGIVPSISSSHLGRFLKRASYSPTA